jgi:murein DD-endopeptidase MepM/ murein hydrolase activator NlpD
MANRYYTFMVVPERSSRVKKWVISRKAVQALLGTAVGLIVLLLVTTVMTLRYLARSGEFNEALLKNQVLESQIKSLEGQISGVDATLVRVQNFEQKLRNLARLDSPNAGPGIGPISPEEQAAIANLDAGVEAAKVTLDERLPAEYGYRMKSMEKSILSLGTRASLQEQSLQDVYELLKDQQSLLASTPSIWPSRGFVSSQFGYRISPFTGLRQLHEGIDVGAPFGSKVIAPADGTVTYVGTDAGYGKVLVINHGYGVVTRYGHNSEILVKPGQRVSRGDAIALVGDTGRTTGAHLHYEVRLNGVPVNPYRYILN